MAPRVDLLKEESAVVVDEKDVAETEAALRVLTETADRESDLKTRELAEAESELKLMKAGNRPEAIRQVGSALLASAGTVICGLGMLWFSSFAKIQYTGPAIALSLAIGRGEPGL